MSGSVNIPVLVASDGQAAPTAAVRFTRSVVHRRVQPGTVGAYLLLGYVQGAIRPLYVGRSDTCLHRRLYHHPLQGIATHFIVTPTRNSDQAYATEAHWYHHLSAGHRLLNRIHPASPAGTARRCPFCRDSALERALIRALSHHRPSEIRSTP
ncbi:hypothetical protein [Streptomyces sp. BV129]|uniref:hypothetical protein n=1 Tax=Streptomyces sp. BV129 TaxID=2849671 RepID=UPI001C2EE5C3|nr:hypothetical protein [Streptomyces sp. BV129]MBV1949672.1 hypothetical protein [Streptomyces sp. BV129]